MKQFNVVISARATSDMGSHVSFLAKVSTSAAKKLAQDFRIAAESLERLPLRNPFLTGEYLPQNKYRYLIFAKRYLLIYQIKNDTVFVDYVLDCRQDYGWLLN
ncbi:MAG: type II toxin-antitoxin system RelE/ParE family toxin [Clostridia bacterium]|nr:type II toxin-antitoxin system RelE/ParE family toxin [Clostridia bacterium]